MNYPTLEDGTRNWCATCAHNEYDDWCDFADDCCYQQNSDGTWNHDLRLFAFLFLCVSVRYGLVNGAIVFSIAFGLTFLIVLAAQRAALNMAYQRGRYDEQKRMFAEPPTNYSQVTRKSPEELAEWLDGTFRAAEWCDISKFPNEDCTEVPCYGCILEWLKREATDGQT